MNKGVIVLAVGAVLVAGGVFTKKTMVESAIKKQLDESVATASMFADIKYKDVSASPFSGEFTISGISITPMQYSPSIPTSEIKIKSITLSDYNVSEEFPDEYSMKINDLSIEVPKNDPRIMSNFGPFADKLGNEVVADIEFNYEFTGGGDKYKMNYMIDVEKIGKIEAGIKSSEMKDALAAAQFFAKNPQTLIMGGPERTVQAALKKANLVEANLDVDNNGLFEIIVQGVAEQQNMNESDVIQRIHKALDHSIKRAERRDEVNGIAFLQEAKKFVDNPKNFEVTVEPGSKKSLMEFMEELNRGKLVKKDSGFKVDFKG